MVVIPSYSSSKLRFPHDLTFFRSHNNNNLNFRCISNVLLFSHNHCCYRQFGATKIWKQGYNCQHDVLKPRCMDEGSFGMSPFGDWGNSEGTSDCIIFSSDGEDSDGEILLTPLNDVEMPTVKKKYVTTEDAFTVTAARLALLGRMRKKDRITYGFLSNLGLTAFLTLCLVLVDWCAWRVVRRPLDAFYFLSPFLASAFLVACAGYVFVPILKKFDVRQKFKRKWPQIYYSKKGTPTIGGLFFIPIGVAVAKVFSGSSTEFSGILMVTLAYAVVGLLDDTIGLVKPQSFGISSGTKFILEVAVAAWFSFWLYTQNLPSPYGMEKWRDHKSGVGRIHYLSLLNKPGHSIVANMWTEKATSVSPSPPLSPSLIAI